MSRNVFLKDWICFGYVLISCKRASLFERLTNVFRELDVVHGTESYFFKYSNEKINQDHVQPGNVCWVSDLKPQSPPLLLLD